MIGKYTNLIIFLTAGAITLIAVVGATFVFPPSGDSKPRPDFETYDEVEALLPSPSKSAVPRYEVVPDPEPPYLPDHNYPYPE